MTAVDEKTQLQLGNRSTYKRAIPLERLGQFAAPVDCPVCGQRNMTKLKYVIGGFTQ